MKKRFSLPVFLLALFLCACSARRETKETEPAPPVVTEASTEETENTSDIAGTDVSDSAAEKSTAPANAKEPETADVASSEEEPPQILYLEAGGEINIRAEASTDAPILGTTRWGELYELIEDQGDWSKIVYNGGEGFVFSEYFETLTEAEAKAARSSTVAKTDATEEEQETGTADAQASAAQETPQEQPQSNAPAFDDSLHHYYTSGTCAQYAADAEAVASSIAAQIMGNPALTSDLQRVTAAAQTVASYCNSCRYDTDAQNHYQSPVGVFVTGVYTCAGSTKALGRVLDYMGYGWTHVNENQWSHQWCVLTMDGQTGYADGMGGFAGYGQMYSGMQLPDGRIIYF